MLRRKKKKTNPEDINKRNDFFLGIWNKRAKNGKHFSEISGKRIYGEILTIYFHHILPKNKYSQAEFDEENIIILLFEEHQIVEGDMYYYEEINKRREQLKIKYNL